MKHHGQTTSEKTSISNDGGWTLRSWLAPEFDQTYDLDLFRRKLGRFGDALEQRLRRVSDGLSAASAIIGSMRPSLRSDVSMVDFSALTIRRAITCALRNSVAGQASRIEPSLAWHAKSTLRMSRLVCRAASSVDARVDCRR